MADQSSANLTSCEANDCGVGKKKISDSPSSDENVDEERDEADDTAASVMISDDVREPVKSADSEGGSWHRSTEANEIGH